ncbi:hypothetical protein IKG54_01205 [Candidatus Saccharibacteria bacterium]|nr:hypothetical protein [Candidatus Saccharibacteria bacterium]
MSVVAKFKKRFYFVAARYFKFFADRSLKRWAPRIIAVTGSVGKTTMLHLIEKELGSRAHYSHDANSAFGVAFDLVGLKGIKGSKSRWLYLIFAVPIKSLFYHHTEEFYIVEIDGERPHEAEFVASWLEPEVSLWISFGLSHAVQFEKQVEAGTFPDLKTAIAHEFATIPRHTVRQVYIDGDIPEMVESTKGLEAKVTKCYKSELEKYTVYPDHSDFTVNGQTFHFATPQPKDLVIQLVMLEKLCKFLKVKLITDFSDLPLPPGRSSFFEGVNGLKIIDSSYNAHLISMESILEMAKSLRAPHKWLVIGDIVDQGSIESEEHKKLAAAIANVKPDQVVLVGHRTNKYTLPILKKKKIKAVSFLEPTDALEYIKKHTKGNETLIFKGSQYLEWIIEKLLKNPEDINLLPRREKAAIARRKKRGLDS